MSFTMQTPPRPLPGAYLQTPAAKPAPSASPFQASTSLAAVARSPFAAPSPPGQGTVSQRVLKLPAPTTSSRDLQGAERAAKTLNETFTQESRFSDLDQYLTPGKTTDYDVQTGTPWTPFQKIKTYNMPDQIFEQYNRAQVSTSMGLFAELSYAWFTIDNALYMWDYTSSNPQFLGFESQPHNITAVSLAVPRAGVFLSSISHVIVLATTREVILLGLGSQPGPAGAKTYALYQTGMSISLKGHVVTNIAASNKTGRIFFSEQGDNDVYEFAYQQEEKWFSSRCSKINHTADTLSNLGLPLSELPFFSQRKSESICEMIVDDTRNLLYTLSSTSTIRVFHMSKEGHLNLVITKPLADIYNNIGHIIPANESLNSRIGLVSISAIPATEAAKYHLVATTTTGYRIYLSVLTSAGWIPTHMAATHVKTPPQESIGNVPQIQMPSAQAIGYQSSSQASGPVRSLTSTRIAQRYPPGYFFCFVAKDPASEVDEIFMSTPDSGRLPQPPEPGQPTPTAETATWFSLGGRAEAIGISTPYSPPSPIPGAFGKELTVQFDKPSPEIAILTNTGVQVIRRRRLVDIFASIATRGGGGGDEGPEGDVKSLIRLYGRTETLATALAVACGQGSDMSADARTVRINDPEVLDFARKVFIEYGGKPTVNENRMVDQSIPAIDTVKASPRHDAIALYLARLLRSVWQTPIVKEARGPTGTYAIKSAVPLSKIQDVQKELTELQSFFTTNKTFIDGLSGPEALTRATNRQEETALQGEHRAVYSLVRLVADAIEGLSFVLVLFEERVEEILPLLPDEIRPQFLQLTFESLFSSKTGFDIAKDLVKAIVNRNIAKGSNVETIAEALRRRCGNFCSAEDVVIFKAQELLKRASEVGPNTDYGRNLLNESLALFQQAAEKLPMENLQSTIKQYIDMQFFAGAIQLALRVAKESDKTDEALSWMNDGKPADDRRQVKFEGRTRCYDLIHDIAMAVENASQNVYSDGQATLLATKRREAYEVISKSTDEVFLTNLYDWYLSQGWEQRLLDTESFFIVTYLERKASHNIAHADLLCRYYGRSNRFFDAAKVQLDLAKSSYNLSLERRIEYLSRAKANASTNTLGTGRQSKQKLLHEIADSLDVANIQLDILQRLKVDPRLEADRREEVLNIVGGRIMHISELFNKYADEAGYYDLCLLLLQVADYRNTAEIKNTWQLLLQKTHDEATASEQVQPWEAVAEIVRDLGARMRMSESIFPINFLLFVLEKYAFEHQRNVGPATWVVDLFLTLQVPFEKLFTVLEAIFYSNEVPFNGNNRRVIGNDLVYVIQQWFHETARAGTPVFENEDLAMQVDEALRVLVQFGLDEERTQMCRVLRERISQILH